MLFHFKQTFALVRVCNQHLLRKRLNMQINFAMKVVVVIVCAQLGRVLENLICESQKTVCSFQAL